MNTKSGQSMQDLPAMGGELSSAKLELLDLLLAEEDLATLAAERIPRRPPASVGAGLPLSFAQQRLWVLHQLDPASPAYNIPTVSTFQGTVDPAVLERSVNEVVRRHEVLRTTFRSVGGEPAQEIHEELEVPLPVVDLRGLPGSEAEVRQLAAGEARRPFDLERGPLLRQTLLRSDGGSTLLLTVHHIVSDAWSAAIFRREQSVAYACLAAGRTPSFPELPVQYADFARWQRSWLTGEVLERQLGFWRRALDGAPTVLDLPLDHPRPPVRSGRGAQRVLPLSGELLAALRDLARREGATLFMVVLAAFQVLLARSTGQLDIVVGSPVANRNRPEIRDLIGFFVNTLVLRTDLSGDPPFREVAARAREAALRAYDHQDLPFERLVEELGAQRDPSSTPLFQILFGLQHADEGGMAPEDVVGTGTAKFDLTLLVEDAGRAGAVFAEYSTDLFDAATIARLLEHLRVLFAAAVAAPGRRISELPLLAAGEQAQVLVEWSDSVLERPPGPLVHDLFAAHAARRPEATAVVGREGRLTYGELDALSNRLAHHLIGLGVGPDGRVAVCMERTLARVVAIVAVLKAGGAYVSLDPGYPRERLAWLLEDARAAVLLTQEGLLERLPPTAATVLCLDGSRERFAGDETPPRTRVEPESLAYVVYTSGSTGRPKGVEIPHAGLLNLVRWHQDLYGVGPDDRGTQVASPAFDASIWELWPYLAAGASSHIPDDETRLSAPGMVHWWADQGITLAYLPTPLAEGVLEEGVLPAPELRVRALIIGGDRLRRRPAPGTPFRLMNHYGPAEYSIVTTVCEVVPQQAGGGGERLPTIGRAVDNTQLYVLDAHLRPVGIGVIGELYVGGIGLARGYLGRPDLTAAAFLPHLLAGSQAGAGERLYRTGDLVRWLPDGDLEFLGRLDHQVKLRGMRVELGEIEAALAGHAAVRECAVLMREDSGRRLVAYVAADPDVTAEHLRALLAETLPAYMVPSQFVFLDALPLTSNGKLDRRALPKPEAERHGEELFVAPRDGVEELLAALWAEVLGLPRVGVNDNFFALGGDSVEAIRLIARANREGLLLTARQMFEHPTVAGLAAAARSAAPLPEAAPSSDDFGWSRDDQDEIAAAIARAMGGQ